MIPVRYNIGSLWNRKVGTLMTILGIGLTVSIFVAMMALVYGLDATFVETGHDYDLVVVRQGGLNEVNSFFNRSLFQTVRFLPGVARGSNGVPLACGEIVVVIAVTRKTGDSSNVLVRGTSELGISMRPEAKLVRGRWLQPGLREIVVSTSLANRFQDMNVGDSLAFGRSPWTVVGVFDAGGTAYDSEIWANYNEIAQEWERHIYSSILVRAENEAAATDIIRRIADDERIKLQAIPQKKYYADQTSTSVGVKALGYFIAVVMGIGAGFAAMNMMYGAVMSRAGEVATLRALGFQRRSILASFLLESLIVSALGGVVGCLLALPVNGISTGTANFQSFSEVLFNFRITPQILAEGILFALVVGVLGGYLPARRASKVKLADVMKE